MSELDLNVISVIISIASLVTSLCVLYVLKQQTNKISKHISADVSLKMIEIIRREDYQRILKMISKGEDLDDDNIQAILIFYEDLALLWDDGVIDYNHILHQHGTEIKNLLSNKHVSTKFTEYTENDRGFVFVYAKKLFKRIDKDLSKQLDLTPFFQD